MTPAAEDAASHHPAPNLTPHNQVAFLRKRRKTQNQKKKIILYQWGYTGRKM